ncbi:uncharacterized protein VP01_3443g4 [Puccinia sorghi]|uniref:Uncharacterized protein n=1 Tax=Puccinia sorghi TaxID=27349 RepID=A0A0L6UWA0_9BASI|nr:uncharacterized protein VP01_3443g4 [Puccinia sorghi]
MEKPVLSINRIYTLNRNFLAVWKLPTILGYNCAVKKILAYKRNIGEEVVVLPISRNKLEGFLFCVGISTFHNIKVLSASHHKVYKLLEKTIEKYFWNLGIGYFS